MVKLLKITALVANLLLTVSSTDASSKSKVTSSSSTSSASASSSSQSSSSSSAESNSSGCDNGQPSKQSEGISDSCSGNGNVTCSGPNEYYSCGGACDNVCATLSQQNQTNCPIINIKCNEMCYCEEGYARDVDNICIPIEECSTCPEGEIYNTCPPEKCDAENCPLSRNSPTSCKSPKNCGKPRCTCGYLKKRDRTTGQCVFTQDCPPFECDGPNEEYQSCPPACPGEECIDFINYSINCPTYKIGIAAPCKPQCRCKENYYRNCKGICIEARLCQNATTTIVNVTFDIPVPSCVATETSRQRLTAGTNLFAYNLLMYVLGTTDDNVIVSPLSIEILLAELALYTNGDSYNQLIYLFNLESKQEVRDAFKSYLEILRSQTDVEFDIAAKTYVNDNYQLSDPFKQDTVETFGAPAENIDCSDPTQAAATMNQWVEDNTINLIQDLVSPDMVKPDTVLFLLGATYFKGKWLHQFNANNTEDRDFYVNKNTTKQVQYMYQQNKFNYIDSSIINAKVLSMPYENSNFTCFFLLPNDTEGLNDILDFMYTDFDNVVISELLKMTTETVKVWIPKAEIDTTINLTDALKKTGITYILDPSTSGLDGILSKPAELYVSSGVQKAYIKMNEEGSEAAAANVVGVSTTSVSVGPTKDLEFDANHPFIIFITQEDTILFIGAFRK